MARHLQIEVSDELYEKIKKLKIRGNFKSIPSTITFAIDLFDWEMKILEKGHAIEFQKEINDRIKTI
jgi:hypothetical protein